MDVCYLRYKEKCSVNAVCDEKSPEGPECVCNDGYHGDGLNCLRINAPIGLLPIVTLFILYVYCQTTFSINFKMLGMNKIYRKSNAMC